MKIKIDNKRKWDVSNRGKTSFSVRLERSALLAPGSQEECYIGFGQRAICNTVDDFSVMRIYFTGEEWVCSDSGTSETG